MPNKRTLLWWLGLRHDNSKPDRFLTPYKQQDLDENTLRFILNHGEKLLTSTVETSDSLTNRATGLLQVIVPVLVADIGYIATCFSSDIKNVNIAFLLYALLLCTVLLISTVTTVIMYKPTKISDVGARPIKLSDKQYLTKPKDLQEKFLLMNEIELCDHKIKFMLAENERRAFWFNQSLLALLYGVVVAVCYLFIIGD